MKKRVSILLIAAFLLQPFFSFWEDRVVFAFSEDFVEFTSSTFIEYWYHINNPNKLSFDSVLTNGNRVRRDVTRQEFFMSNFTVEDASFLPIPAHVKDVDLIEFELVSKQAHVLDPRTAPNPNNTFGLQIIENYKGTGERRLRVPIVSYPYLAQKSSIINPIPDSDRGRGHRYDTKVTFKYKFPPPELPDIPDGYCYGNKQTSVTGISGWYYVEDQIYYYYETLSLVNVRGPSPSEVKAGQGSELIITTRYTNQNPAHRNRAYAPAKLTFTGLNTDDWPNSKTEVVELIPNVSNPERHWGSGKTVEWRLPYAKFDEEGNWTKHTVLPNINENNFEYGGFQRWYVGFDVPDNQRIPLTFDSLAGYKNTLEVCDERHLNVQGSPFDDFIIRAVDPDNPFPTETGLNWQGNEAMIIDLSPWYNAQQLTRPDKESEQELEHNSIFTKVKEFFTFNR